MSGVFAQTKYANLESLDHKINEVFEKNMHRYADEIREERENQRDFNDEEVFVMRNCEPTSKKFLPDVKTLLSNPKLIKTKGHVYIEGDALVSGKKSKIIIDPTYRQFFGVDVIQKHGIDAEIRQILLTSIPKRVLVIPAKNLRQTLESSFSYRPEWLVEIPILGAPSTYENWYLKY